MYLSHYWIVLRRKKPPNIEYQSGAVEPEANTAFDYAAGALAAAAYEFTEDNPKQVRVKIVRYRDSYWKVINLSSDKTYIKLVIKT